MSLEVFYLTYRQIQAEIDKRFMATGEGQNPSEIILSLHRDGASFTCHDNLNLSLALRACHEDEFLVRRRELLIEFQEAAMEYRVEHPFVPTPEVPATVQSHKRTVDVFVNTPFYNAISKPHVHKSMFEVIFVYQGACHFVFEGEHRLLGAGDFCIIAPGSRHEIYIDGPEDFVIQQYIYSANFRTSFINILEDDSIIPNFFKMILANQNMCNYLLLTTQNNVVVRQTARSLFLEQFSYDAYSPSCTLYWMQLLFSYILRDGIHAYQVSSNFTNIDFMPILEYLRGHYKNATLSDVAEHFHYSVAYLSATIKRITGHSYSSIIKDMKMREASEYLLYTEKNIEEIALLVGYNSADHFSRVFRAYYGTSPSAYRAEEDARKRTQ